MHFAHIFLSGVCFVPQHVFNKPSLLLLLYYTGAHVDRATDLQ